MAPTSAELERDGADPDLDDSGWLQLPVPGHWAQYPDWADEPGPVVYRHRFAHQVGDEADDGSRRWLRLDGVLAEAEVWLDGRHLGDNSTYFAPHRFEVTDLLATPGPRDDGDHLVAVTVTCGDGDGADDKPQRSLIGSFQSGPLAPPGNVGGLWGPVAIDTTGPAAITQARLLCTAATDEVGTLAFHVTVDTVDAGPVRIDTSISGPFGRTAGGAAEHVLASGENILEWTVDIPDPELWWPASLGDQPRYDVTVAVRADGATVSDRRSWRTGVRTIEVDDLQWRVNGRRLFIKGVAVGPHGRFPASIDSLQYRKDVRAVADAGLDLIRVHGHISRRELYDEADERGVLIWQDLPLVGPYTAGTRARVSPTVTAAVDLLGHHPSVSLWCGHDEPNGPPIPLPDDEREGVGHRAARLGRHLLPSWNRSVLDPGIRRALRSTDPTRPVITRSGNLPNPVDFTSSDAHLWLGWRSGQAVDLPRIIRSWPRLGTFIGAIGTQSVVVRDWPANAPDWPTAQKGSFNRYMPRAAYSDGESWALATQAYQASVIRVQIETARRLKYTPTGGFCIMSLFDAEPSGGFGVLSAGREPKQAFDALIDACRPVVVVGDLPPPVVAPGQTLSMAVHAVNDLPEALGPAIITATATMDAWRVERRWQGHLDADACSFIGTLDFEVPSSTGAMVIDLSLEAADHAATNRYQTVVIPPSEALTPTSSKPLR